MGLCQGLWALYSQTTRFTIAIWNPQQQHFPQAMDCAKGRTVVYPGAQQALDLVICPYNWVGEMTPKILKCQKNGYAVWMCVCVCGVPLNPILSIGPTFVGHVYLVLAVVKRE